MLAGCWPTRGPWPRRRRVDGGLRPRPWPSSARQGRGRRRATRPRRAFQELTGIAPRLSRAPRARREPLRASRTARGPTLTEEELRRPLVASSTPRRSSRAPSRRRRLMPQPNIQNMLKQAQEIMAAQQEAQEALKERERRGLGGRRHGQGRRHRRPARSESLTIDPDAVDPEDVEMLQDLVLAATNEALRQAVDLQDGRRQGAAVRPDAALEGSAWAARSAAAAEAAVCPAGRPKPRGPPRAEEECSLFAPPVQRLVTELGKLPGIGQRTAQRLAFHILRIDARGGRRARRRDPRGQGADRPCEICFNLAEGPRCRSARTSAATRGSSASSRSPAT